MTPSTQLTTANSVIVSDTVLASKALTLSGIGIISQTQIVLFVDSSSFGLHPTVLCPRFFVIDTLLLSNIVRGYGIS